jgi:hypothetical protein
MGYTGHRTLVTLVVGCSTVAFCLGVVAAAACSHFVGSGGASVWAARGEKRVLTSDLDLEESFRRIAGEGTHPPVRGRLIAGSALTVTMRKTNIAYVTFETVMDSRDVASASAPSGSP